jgi:hypothetical protein
LTIFQEAGPLAGVEEGASPPPPPLLAISQEAGPLVGVEEGASPPPPLLLAISQEAGPLVGVEEGPSPPPPPLLTISQEAGPLVGVAQELGTMVTVVGGSVTVLVIAADMPAMTDMMADSRDWILPSMARISENCVPLLAAVSVTVMIFVIIVTVHDGTAVVANCETEPDEDVVDAAVPPANVGVPAVLVAAAAVASKQLQALVRASPPVVPTQLGTEREVVVRY